MRAIMVDDGGVRLESSWAEPIPRAGEAICAPIRCAVDEGDLRAARSGSGFVGVLGHQFVATVQDLSPDVSPAERERWLGARVVGSADVSCGKCDLCRGGLGGHCRERAVLGIDGRDGVFADRFAIPVRNLVRVPDGVDDDAAVLASCLAGVVHLPQMVRVEHKPYITVLGDSASALLAAQRLSPLNASVRVLGTDPARFELCEKWGVRHRHIDEAGRRADQDVVIVTGSSPAQWRAAVGMVRPRGAVVLCAPPEVGEDEGGAGLDLGGVVRGELRVLGARRGSVAEALHEIASGAVDTSGLITRRCRLGDGVVALRAAMEPAQIRVVIDP
ncbi:MAG: hypothetical protein EA378_01135 [Phycisphaerales bacterium]|nr:MAG: hypothetical protein EA378_01135 [Phycisphaerales bacterium]